VLPLHKHALRLSEKHGPGWSLSLAMTPTAKLNRLYEFFDSKFMWTGIGIDTSKCLVPLSWRIEALETELFSHDRDFILDRHPEAENVWIVGGFSGYAFKHGPVMGRKRRSRM
jgi:hypothetical protein